MTEGELQEFFKRQSQTSGERLVEIGRALIALKAACRHGEFLLRLETLGVGPAKAQKAMAVAQRLGGRKRLIAAAGSGSKLIELLVLDDDELDRLEATGTLKPSPATTPQRRRISPASPNANGSRPSPEQHGAILEAAEERLLHSYRQCGAEARAALLQMAALLARTGPRSA
ncbi:hypothetical protein [Variovorax sp.]|jgi:hypothetical protein|uniref:hypothetical protein n=1 Tax=Variovorax sp. TaxID=1871043 RepID=UPI003BA99675|eukprot:TRINITY_DN9275_c0_g1_i1.p1 TRINITY_DN9275_c0_g1~~TRINITY_DN9275_c0_g1_i1.p1  ORF type:complete len:172 (+),score=22.89 TRINITY_DN9275_c0_g1_i1:159-674(+)